jgi:hypothetical protein
MIQAKRLSIVALVKSGAFHNSILTCNRKRHPGGSLQPPFKRRKICIQQDKSVTSAVLVLLWSSSNSTHHKTRPNVSWVGFCFRTAIAQSGPRSSHLHRAPRIQLSRILFKQPLLASWTLIATTVRIEQRLVATSLTKSSYLGGQLSEETTPNWLGWFFELYSNDRAVA